MSDPLNYTLVRIDNNIPDRSVLCYDAVNDKIVSTGMTSDVSGELQAAAGSIHVGVQSMESSGEQVTWTNIVSGVTYAPPWHIVDGSNPGGSYDRFYGPLTTVVRFPNRETVVVDPVMNVYIPTDTLAISFNFTWPEAQPGVVFEWFSAGSDTALWRQVHDVSAGTHDEIWKTPLAYRAGNYVFKMYRLDGQPLKVMGDSVTGYAGYSVKYREFTDKQLATKEFVAQAVANGGGNGTGGGSSDDPFSDTIDMSQFTKANMFGMTAIKDVGRASSVTLNMNIPDDMNLVVLSAVKKLPDLSVRPVAKLDWIYSNTTNTLKVSFGEEVLAARVTLGIYV